MLRVGLTGGIASGKSLVADRFSRLGTPVADADAIAREVVAPDSPGLAAVVAAFGEDILAADGRLDRARLRQRIFGDDRARERLEGILHPRIRERMDERLAAHAAAGAAYAVAVIPLLIETGQIGRFDRILVIDAPVEIQIARVIERDGGDAASARAIIDRQAGRWQRLSLADDVLANGDAVAPGIALDGPVTALDRKYRLFAEP